VYEIRAKSEIQAFCNLPRSILCNKRMWQ